MTIREQRRLERRIINAARVLQVLMDSQPCSLGLIAEKLGVHHQALHRSAAWLERNGLVIHKKVSGINVIELQITLEGIAIMCEVNAILAQNKRQPSTHGARATG